MEWSLFISIFSLIFIAELPDKTAFATLLMATRGNPLAIFVGVAAAFLVQSGIAVGFGRLISLAPEKWVHLGAGLMFLFFAYQMWFHHDEEEAETEKTTPKIARKTHFLKASSKAFMVVFIAEWGDLTQLATASLAAKYHESLITVFLASTLALWAVTAVAIIVGHNVKHAIHPVVLKKIGIVVFLGVGLYFIYTWYIA